MDIPAISTMLSQVKVQQAASISVMKMAMNSAENSGEFIKEITATNTKMLEMSINPNVGGNIDIKA